MLGHVKRIGEERMVEKIYWENDSGRGGVEFCAEGERCACVTCSQEFA